MCGCWHVNSWSLTRGWLTIRIESFQAGRGTRLPGKASSKNITRCCNLDSTPPCQPHQPAGPFQVSDTTLGTLYEGKNITVVSNSTSLPLGVNRLTGETLVTTVRSVSLESVDGLSSAQVNLRGSLAGYNGESYGERGRGVLIECPAQWRQLRALSCVDWSPWPCPDSTPSQPNLPPITSCIRRGHPDR